MEVLLTSEGGKFGSALIDTRFKSWLRKEIGIENYAIIDPDNAKQRRISPHTSETGAMRELIGRFNIRKAAFSNSTRADIKIELGKDLNSISIPGRVDQGQLTIHV